jgi:hypothetical protein
LVFIVPFIGDVRLANLGMAINSAVTLLVSLVIPWAERLISSKRTYLLCLCSQFALMTWLVFLRDDSRLETLLVLGLLGVPWAGALVLPYSLAGKACRGSTSRGLGMAVLNVSVCIPQVLVSLSSKGILAAAAGDFRAMFVAAAVALFLACAILPWLDVE